MTVNLLGDLQASLFSPIPRGAWDKPMRVHSVSFASDYLDRKFFLAHDNAEPTSASTKFVSDFTGDAPRLSKIRQ